VLLVGGRDARYDAMPVFCGAGSELGGKFGIRWRLLTSYWQLLLAWVYCWTYPTGKTAIAYAMLSNSVSASFGLDLWSKMNKKEYCFTVYLKACD